MVSVLPPPSPSAGYSPWFNILLSANDLPDAVSLSTIVTFTDDTKLFKRITSYTGSNKLHKDLNTLEQWSTTSNLTFNATKCKVETISLKCSKLIKTCSMMGDLGPNAIQIIHNEKAYLIIYCLNCIWCMQN